jgi:uncharacterized membrane protein YphA (DoxX/SURF4 family)
MEAFVQFLRRSGFPAPQVLATLSVYAQFTCGVLPVPGSGTWWSGFVMLFNFAVATYMVHWQQDFLGRWPAMVLMFLSPYFGLRGARRLSVDRLLQARLVR